MFSHVFVSHSVQGEWVSLVPGPFWTWISLVGMSPGWVRYVQRGWLGVYVWRWVCPGVGMSSWVWLEVGMSGGWVCPGGGGYVHGGAVGIPLLGHGTCIVRLVGGMHPT